MDDTSTQGVLLVEISPEIAKQYGYIRIKISIKDLKMELVTKYNISIE